MPLTALLPDGEVDLTACPDEVWSALHRPQVPAPLSCRSCDGPLHAKVSPRGLRFFAHNRRTEDCPTTGESAEHLALKADLARLIRQAGGTSIVEASPSPGDAGGWRADVLGIGANGRRIAFEAQLAAMTVDVGRERTARYAADGIGTVWVTTRQAPWLYGLPGIQVDPDHDHVLEGLAELVDDVWRVRQGPPLARCLQLWLAGQIAHLSGVHLYEDRPNRVLARSGAVIWATEQDARRWRVLQQQRRAAEIRAAEQQEAYARHLEALGERQLRLLRDVVPKIAAQAAATGHRVWLGRNTTFWQEHRSIELADAFGNEKTGFGCPIWTGPSVHELSLTAVVCPPANRVSPGLGRSWKARRVTVCVADRQEAARVARALNWPVDHVKIVDAPPLPARPPRPAAAEQPAPPAAPHTAVSTLTTAQRQASQLRLLRTVVPLIAEEAGGPERVFLGRPPLQWNVQRPITLRWAVGLQDKDGSTTPRVWTGASPSAAVLHTAVSPDPTTLTQDLGDRWRALGVRVVVETADEAAATAHKLAWPVSDITVSGTS